MPDAAPHASPLIRKALIRLGRPCNNRCLFCHSPSDASPGLDTDTVVRKIQAAADQGADMAVFSGGEPTIRKDLPDLCREARRRGLLSGIITNGRMLFYRDLADQLLDAGLEYALVSLHGPDAATHNALTGADAFEQTLAGLGNLAGRVPRLVVNTVLTTANAARLSGIARLLEPFAPLHFKISIPEPKGTVLSRPDLMPHPAAAARSLRGFLSKPGPESRVSVGVDGLTPCLLPDFFSMNDDFFSHGFFLVSEPDENTFFTPDYGDRAFGPRCAFCSWYGLCPGLYAHYFSLFPDLDPEPVCEPVSNAVRLDPVPAFEAVTPGAACRALRLARPHPARALALERGRRVTLFATSETHTTAPELFRIKRGLQQVYHAPGPAHGPGDFTKLQLSARCQVCARTALCPGIFVRARRQPFPALMAHMRDLVAGLHGRVCEIGCGNGPYFEPVREALRAGRITAYVGVDPAPALTPPDSMHGAFQLVQSTLEDFQWPGPAFDCVALFRSWHHLRDLPRAMAALRNLVAPGGVALFTEDARFLALHETPDPPREQSGLRFEHFRNHGPDQLREVIERFGFRTLAVHAITPDTCAHWTVIAERTRPGV